MLYNPEWSGLKKLIALKTAALPIVEVEATATGNPATFETGLVRPLVSCEAAFVPVQSGSGTPAPDNVRPISGWTGLTVYHSGANISNPDTYPVSWQTEAGTVYGGTVVLASGTLKVGWAYKEYIGASDENWSVENIAQGANFYITAPSDWKRNTGITDLACNIAKPSKDLGAVGNIRVSQYGNLNVYIGSLIGKTSAAEFKEWLADHHLQVACELQTPVTYQLTTQSIQTIHGTNTVWSNANGDLTIKYLKKG